MFRKIAAALAVTLFAGVGIAEAATLKVTEGKRPAVVGSSKIGDVFAPGGADGFDVGSIDGNVVEIYGRVTSAVDLYVYDFVTSGGVFIDFIFGGIETVNGPVDLSGLTGDDGKDVLFELLAADDTVLASKLFKTDITDGDANIFTHFGAGEYSLRISGTTKQEALYDIRISAVPLPASVLLLLAGVGGLTVAARRKA